MAMYSIPAPIAANPAQRMSFEAVGFMLLSLIVAACRLVFMCLSPSIPAVRLVEIMSLSPFLKRVIRVRVGHPAHPPVWVQPPGFRYVPFVRKGYGGS